MSITQTAQTDTGFTEEGVAVDVISKLNRITFFNVDDKDNVTVQGKLLSRIKDTKGIIGEKNATLNTTDLFSGWSVPDPASTEETPLPDIVVSTGLTAAELKGFKDGFKGVEKLFALKRAELKDLPHDSTDVFV